MFRRAGSEGQLSRSVERRGSDTGEEQASMEMGIVGLGRMGGNMAERLIRGGHEVVGSDPAAEPRARLAGIGGAGVGSLAELIAKLQQTPKVVWSMVPAGKVTESVIEEA